jgi:hypothetical protein
MIVIWSNRQWLNRKIFQTMIWYWCSTLSMRVCHIASEIIHIQYTGELTLSRVWLTFYSSRRHLNCSFSLSPSLSGRYTNTYTRPCSNFDFVVVVWSLSSQSKSHLLFDYYILYETMMLTLISNLSALVKWAYRHVEIFIHLLIWLYSYRDKSV